MIKTRNIDLIPKEETMKFQIVCKALPSTIAGIVKKTVGVNEVHLICENQHGQTYSSADLKYIAARINMKHSGAIKVHVLPTSPAKATIEALNGYDILQYLEEKCSHILTIERAN